MYVALLIIVILYLPSGIIINYTKMIIPSIYYEIVP